MLFCPDDDQVNVLVACMLNDLLRGVSFTNHLGDFTAASRFLGYSLAKRVANRLHIACRLFH
jgi:hypothetical protein